MPPKFSRQTTRRIISPEWSASQPRTSPCEVYCPAGNPIQKVSTLVNSRQIEEALSYVRSRNPFPGITGRVCAHPCEHNCNRNSYDQGVSIRALERFVADTADLTRTIKAKKEKASGKTVAVIGSGPAGLTCAYFLALFGHAVTIFESSPVPGGIPRLAIPDFRLPKDVVEREIALVCELGIEMKFNTRIGRDIGFNTILDNFDACVIATGAGKDKILDIAGAGFALPGVTFLSRVNMGWRGPVGQKVVIAGGGGVAFDCAFTARRLGAEKVTVICVEGRENMCASAEDLAMAKAEGIEIMNSCTIVSVTNDGTKATGIEYSGIAAFWFDEKGRLFIEPKQGKSGIVSADTVISAIGVSPDIDFLPSDSRFTLLPNGTIQVNEKNHATPLVEKVFAAGDVVTGPSMVASAIGEGRRTAVAVDRFLSDTVSGSSIVRITIGPTGNIAREECPEPGQPHIVAYEEILNVDFHEKKDRYRPAPAVRKAMPSLMDEIEGRLDANAAGLEAARCFHCGHCTSCGNCVTDCPLYVLAMCDDGPQVAHFDECWHCGCCRIACPGSAVLYEFPLNMLV
jgi:formate dehydrogenase (NADP+) beta subunit